MSGSGIELLRSLLPWTAGRPRIFISYRRRGDSAGFAARLADRLVAHFGDEQCFRDIEDIETGADFVQSIEEAVASSRVMVVVIGTDWATVEDAEGNRRLDNPADFVRIEVATALRRGIRVIPVLVAGAKMPSNDGMPDELQGLFRRQALELTDSRWDYDVGQLTTAIEGLGLKSREKRTATLLARRLRWSVGAVLVAVSLVGVGAWLATQQGAVGDDDAQTQGLLDASSMAGPPAGDGAGDGAPDGARDEGGGPAAASPSEARQPVRDPKMGASTPREEVVASQPAPQPSLADRYRAELIDAIDMANEEQNYAQETLDVTGLADIFTGDALQLQLGAVAGLYQGGELSFNTMVSQRYGEFRVDPSATSAQVDVVERWTAEHRSAITGVCMHRIPAHDVPQTVHLVRVPGGWMIANITGDPIVEPDAVGC